MGVRVMAAWDFRGPRPPSEKLRSLVGPHRLVVEEGPVFGVDGVYFDGRAMLLLPFLPPTLRLNAPFFAAFGAVQVDVPNAYGWRGGFIRNRPVTSDAGYLCTVYTMSPSDPANFYVDASDNGTEVFSPGTIGHPVGAYRVETMEWDGSTARSYLDGALHASVAATQNVNTLTPTGYFFLGGPSTSTGMPLRGSKLRVLWAFIASGQPTVAERTMLVQNPDRFLYPRTRLSTPRDVVIPNPVYTGATVRVVARKYFSTFPLTPNPHLPIAR